MRNGFNGQGDTAVNNRVRFMKVARCAVIYSLLLLCCSSTFAQQKQVKPLSGRERELERMVDALASRYKPPPAPKEGEYERAFPKDYDMKEYDRVRQAAWALSQDASNDLWGRLVEHFDDKRFAIMTKWWEDERSKKGDPNITRWTVGKLCSWLASGQVTCAHLLHLDTEKTRGVGTTDFIWGDDVRILPGHAQHCLQHPFPPDFNGWCQARKSKPLFEIQIGICEWAIKGVESNFPAPNVIVMPIPEGPKKKYIAALKQEIESLRKNKKSVVDHSPWATPLSEQSLHREDYPTKDAEPGLSKDSEAGSWSGDGDLWWSGTGSR